MSSTKISSKVLNRNEPLSKHTYIKLGGPADLFTIAGNADELAAAVMAAENMGVPWFILGGGSNILVGDLGFRGLVIKNEARSLELQGSASLTRQSLVMAESGVKMSQLAAFAIENGLGGLEPFMSVPGTVGGAIYNNSHFRPSRNEFIGNLVEEAEILNKSYKSYKNYKVSRSWFKFGYDYSRLQEERAVVLKVKFRLKRESPSVLRERSLAMMKQRNQHQPIGRPSCGCMFKNPGGVSAGKLIDEAGLKGTRIGGMSVSDTHANFMVNDGTAKVGDVLELMARVKERVKEKFGVKLEPEIFMVGEFSKCQNL